MKVRLKKIYILSLSMASLLMGPLKSSEKNIKNLEKDSVNLKLGQHIITQGFMLCSKEPPKLESLPLTPDNFMMSVRTYAFNCSQQGYTDSQINTFGQSMANAFNNRGSTQKSPYTFPIEMLNGFKKVSPFKGEDIEWLYSQVENNRNPAEASPLNPSKMLLVPHGILGYMEEFYKDCPKLGYTGAEIEAFQKVFANTINSFRPAGDGLPAFPDKMLTDIEKRFNELNEKGSLQKEVTEQILRELKAYLKRQS